MSIHDVFGVVGWCLERVQLALRGGVHLSPCPPPLEVMVNLRVGVGPPPRDDGPCQGGSPPLGMMVVVTSVTSKYKKVDLDLYCLKRISPP